MKPAEALSVSTLRRIEEAAQNSWPAAHQLLYDGWVLRLSGGYTKRANSVNPLYAGGLPVEEKVAFCEALYTAQGLPPVFRLIEPFVPSGLEEVLTRRGYRLLDASHVMTLRMGEAMLAEDEGELRTLSLDEWLPLYAHFSAHSARQRALHRQILEGISLPLLFAAISEGDAWRACGLGVLQGDLFGLFDIITHPDHRRRGWAGRLIAGMLAWAARRGAVLTYLQVIDANRPARRLYERIGFRDAYWYRYRVHPSFD